jgi:hypothetical protein
MCLGFHELGAWTHLMPSVRVAELQGKAFQYQDHHDLNESLRRGETYRRHCCQSYFIVTITPILA